MDKEAKKYIKGVSYQWAGKLAVQRCNECFLMCRLFKVKTNAAMAQTNGIMQNIS